MNDNEILLTQMDEEFAAAREEARRLPIETYDWGTFDPNGHIYRDLHGRWIPSVTQILKESGLGSDFSMVSEEYLAWKATVGTRVHWLTDMFDCDMPIQADSLTMDTEGYFESWKGFRRLSNVTIKRVSIRMIANVNGILWGMEADKEAMIGGRPAIFDLKCSDMNPPGWGYQLAGYEMGLCRSSRCGHGVRAVVRLHKNGAPGTIVDYPNHVNDAQQFLAAALNTHERIKIGNLKLALA